MSKIFIKTLKVLSCMSHLLLSPLYPQHQIIKVN